MEYRIPVTQPFVPPLEEVYPYLQRIWAARTLTNNGPLQAEFETALQNFLGVEYVAVVCNATIGLMLAQRALDVSGEIITTPYSFVATAQAIEWAGNTPVFADVSPHDLNIDPHAIEAAITDKTVAIMPLHCYGNNADIEAISLIAERNNLKVIYDACHSFGAQDEGGGVARHGDASVFSLHATKVFNTFEGGLVVCKSKEAKEKIDLLKNFGFEGPHRVATIGLNGKMSEFNSAVGLAGLPYFEVNREKREKLDSLYRSLLAGIPSITCQVLGLRKPNFAYFPIYVSERFPLQRDELADLLLSHGYYCRKYFSPIIPAFDAFKGKGIELEKLAVAENAARKVLCLPLYTDLEEAEVRRISEIITSAALV